MSPQLTIKREDLESVAHMTPPCHLTCKMKLNQNLQLSNNITENILCHRELSLSTYFPVL